jgi:23S rRNA pseudouridine955/2504/2580 synthase
MKELTIRQTEAGQRLDKFLSRCLPGAGQGFLYKMLRKKNIVLNDHKAGGRELLAAGDRVKLYFSDETFAKFAKVAQEEGPILEKGYVLYEDDQLILVNKPAGMLSQKARPSDISLTELLTAYLNRQGVASHQGVRVFQPGICNRLDRNTSGIVLAGKNLAVTRELSRMLSDRSLQKYYLCLVRGRLQEEGHIFGYLTKNPATNRVRILKSPTPDSSPIETSYQPLAGNEEGTLLKVHLITGKTHQIRSHLASIGHPLAGDPKYGDPAYNRHCQQKLGLSRQFLHAWQLVFPPLQGEEEILNAVSDMTFTAALPGDLKKVMEAAGFCDRDCTGSLGGLL